MYGFPERIHSDQSANFEIQLIRELLHVVGVKKSRIAKLNALIGSMIKALPPRSKEKCLQMLKTLAFAYNCTAHESTVYTPFYLMFCRDPRLPVGVIFISIERDADIADYGMYVKKLRDDLKETLTIVQGNVCASQQHQAELYNRRVKG